MFNADFKLSASDFIVDEILGFTPSGNGQHIMLHIQKQDLNTADITQHLKKTLNVPLKSIGYSGLKDKKAVTRQYFTVDLSGKKFANFKHIETDNIQLLSADYHQRKLKIGSHKANRFEIVLRNIENRADIQKSVDRVLENIKKQGLPNYFGSQRFGNKGSNLTQAKKLFNDEIQIKNHRKRGLLLSAVRSFLFNEICKQRVQDDTWNQAVKGDILQLEGGRSIFYYQQQSDDIKTRLINLDIHPTAPLFGTGGMQSTSDAAEIENEILVNYPELTSGLLQFKINALRRSLRMKIYGLSWFWLDDGLTLNFTLNRGSFATVLIDHLLGCKISGN